MNVHYLELLNYLQELKLHPEHLMEQSTSVFVSEKRLHTDKKINYREKNKFIYDQLFINSTDTDILPRIKSAAEHMAKNYQSTKKINYQVVNTRTLRHSKKNYYNSYSLTTTFVKVFPRLNDWITTQRPNLCQKTKSTLVEVKQ